MRKSLLGSENNKKGKKPKSSILVSTEPKSKNLEVVAGKVDMFGVEDKNPKVEGGKCVFPFNMTTRHKVAGKNISRPWHSYDDVY